jgi:hypothetical protein
MIAERSLNEKRAYLEGFRAGAKFLRERLAKNLDGETAAVRAAQIEVDSVAKLIEDSLSND